MRQISPYNTARTRQMHILTTRADLPAGCDPLPDGIALAPGEPLPLRPYPFRPRKSHDTYRATADDANRMLPNPAKKPAYHDVEKARRAMHSAETASDAALLDAHSPQPGTSVVLTNTMINADVHTAEKVLDTAVAAHRRSPPASRSARSIPASRSSTPRPS